jgi:hypothetical protein
LTGGGAANSAIARQTRDLTRERPFVPPEARNHCRQKFLRVKIIEIEGSGSSARCAALIASSRSSEIWVRRFRRFLRTVVPG